MRRRLKNLGVSTQYCGGTLTAISVEGGGLDVRRLDGQGQLLTGPGLDARLLEVFPELLPHTLTNLTTQLAPAGTETALGVVNPATSGSNALRINLMNFLTEYLASGAVVRYNTTGTGFGPPGSTFSVGTLTDPFGGAVTPSPLQVTQQIEWAWNAAGLNWVEINAEQTNVSPGSKSLSFSTTYNTWSAGLAFQFVTVTYTVPPCATCELNIQVHDGCDGSGVGGAVVTLSNGLTCTTGGGGGCTISSIPDGAYDFTVTHLGYDDYAGSFTCECGGGSQTITIDLEPEGGCAGCELTITVIDFCTGLPLSGVSIIVGGDDCVTDGSGECSFVGLDNGDHAVVIGLTGYNGQAFTWRCNDGAAGSFTVALVSVDGCGGDPPPDSEENGACYRVTFGLMTRTTSPEFAGVQWVTTPEFGVMTKKTTPEFGEMRRA